jgi:putative FmdB family regulatory protein
MPIYVFQCKNCDEVQEYLLKMSESTPNCQFCHSNSLEKQIAQASFQLKGDGWFADGYTKPKKENHNAGQD